MDAKKWLINAPILKIVDPNKQRFVVIDVCKEGLG